MRQLYIYTHICWIHIDAMNKDERSFSKKCTSHFICNVCVWEGVGDWTKTAIYWPSLLWPSALCLSLSPGLLNRRPGALSAGCGLSLPHLITNWSGPQTPSGVPRAPSAGWWLSLPHLVSNSTVSNSLASCPYQAI